MNNSDALPLTAERRVNEICNEFEAELKADRQPRIEGYLRDKLEPEYSALLRELLKLELAYAATGAEFFVNDYVARFPEHAELVRAVFQEATGTQIDDEAPILPEIPGYEIIGILGRGGIAVVYRGRDADLDRDLAIKVLREDRQGRLGLEQRLLEAAQILGQLQHPGIVPIHTRGQLADQRPFFTMKLVKGQTLDALLQARSEPAEDRPRFLKIFEQVCQTVAYAHSRRVIHRDLKPLNIMVGA